MTKKETKSRKQENKIAFRQSENELRYGPDFASSVLDTIGSLVVVLDRRGRIIFFNRACEETTGYSFDEVRNKYVFDVFIPPEEREAVKGVFKQLKAGQFPNRHENYWLTKDGRKRLIAWSNTATVGPDGQVQWVVPTGIDITERKQVEEALRESETLYRATFDQAASGIVHVDLEGKYIQVNQKFCDIVGHTRKELTKLKFQDITYPEDLERDLGLVQKLRAGKIPTFTMEKRYIHKDGHIIWVNLTASLVRTSTGEPKLFIAVIDDITKRKEAEAALRRSEERYRALAEAAHDIIFISNKDGKLEYINSVAADHFGHKPTAVIGETLDKVFPAGFTSHCKQSLKQVFGTGEPVYNETFAPFTGKNSEMWLGTWLTPIKAEDDSVNAVLGIARDITKRKRDEETIRYMAYYDPLTRLPNRVLLNDRLTLAMAQAHRKDELLAVLFLDLDNFKTINDTLGHAVGDELLQGVAQRLQSCLREGDTIARLGGDEFTLLLPQITSSDDAVRVSQKVIEAFGAPFVLADRELHITTSIGIALYPTDGDTAEALLKNADTALYRAKEHGRNNYQLYTPAMNARALERLAMESSLRKALEKNEFTLCYQPQVELKTGTIIGMEALVRWRHPELGLILPMQFIPLTEETGLIASLGQWVLSEACRQNKAWLDAGFAPMRIAVNLSARQFQDENLVRTVEQALAESGLSSKYLALEITESVVMKDVVAATRTLRKLKQIGIQVHIDDFGTGHSSLSYLKKFPIDVLKIDHSFVCDITTDPGDAAIATAIITLAHSLKVKAIAEGVETREQMELLRALGCDAMQGFVFSRPLAANEATKLLKRQGRRCA